MKQLLALLVLSACFTLILNAQQEKAVSLEQDVFFVDNYRFKDSILPDYFDLPLRISPYLSANFGELRSDHFHSGLDFKTQGVINKPVYAIAPAFVSRISVREKGFGKALYLDHPNGYTSVYAHLESFSPKLDSIIKTAQYAAESYEQNLILNAGQVAIERGELVGYTGNTGSSGGPHLHFELRHTESEEPVDPMFWYRDRIRDTRPPGILALAIYALDGQGTLQNRAGLRGAKQI
ncbi:MAG: M23 family metallopeptidase, partial [Bacteroidales bacterium]|nr:M23 family metallopeptidase [Bacteroidales bacterium]